MALTDELLVKISVDTASSQAAIKVLEDSLKGLQSDFQKLQTDTEKTAKAVSGLSATFQQMVTAVGQVSFAFDALKSASDKLLGPFMESSDATSKLSATLRLVGEKDIPKVVKSYQDLAKQLQNTTNAEDDNLVRLAAVARATGLSDEATKKLITTAVDISGVTGDVNSNFETLIQTYKGNARGAATLAPELKNLTELQLKQGSAVDYLAQKFDGFGAATLDTFSGRFQQTKNLVQDIMEDIGQAILQGFNLDNSSNDFNDALKSIKDNLGTTLNVIRATAAAVKDAFGIMGNAADIAANSIIVAFRKAEAGVAGLLLLLPKAAREFLDINEASLQAFQEEKLKQASKSIEQISIDAMDIKDTFVNAGDSVEEFDKKVQKAANRKLPKIAPLVPEEMLKFLEEISKKDFDLRQRIAAENQSELAIIRLKGAAELNDLEVIRKKIDQAKTLTDAQKDQAKQALDAAIELQNSVNQESLRVERTKELVDIAKQNSDILEQTNALGMDAEELAQQHLSIALQEIEARKAALEINAEDNQAQIDALNLQMDLQKKLTAEAEFQRELKKLSPAAQTVGKDTREILDVGSSVVTGIGAFFGVMIPKLSQATENSLALGAAKLTDGIIKGASIASDIIGTLFDPDKIQGLADSLGNLVDKLPDALIKAFNSLSGAFEKVIAKLPQVVTKLFDSLGAIFDKLIAAAPRLIDSLAKALGTFIDRLPDLFQKIFDALPGIIDKLLKTLPTLIKKLFNALGSIISEAIKAFPEVFKALMDNLPDVVESLIEGIISAMGQIVGAMIDQFTNGGAEKIIGSFLRAIPRLIVAIVQGIARGLANAIGSIFNGFKIPNSISSFPDKLAESAKNLGKNISKESSQLFKVVELQAAQRGQDAAASIGKAVDAATTRLGTQFKGLLGGLVAAWQRIYEQIIKPAWDALTAVWRYVFSSLTQLWEGLKAAWDLIVTALTQLWGGITYNLGKLWERLESIWTTAVAALYSLWSYVEQLFTKAADGLRQVFSLLSEYADKFKDAASSAFEKVGELGTKIGDALKNALGSVGDALSSAGTKIWDGLKSSIKWPSFEVPSWLSSLTSFKWPTMPSISASLSSFKWPSFPSLPSSLSSFKWPSFETPSWLSSLTTFKWPTMDTPSWLQGFIDAVNKLGSGGDGGGGGGILPKILGKSHGGMIYAADGIFVPQGTDTVPAMLTPGELVISRPDVHALRAGGTLGAPGSLKPTVQNYDINVDICFAGLPDENFVRTKMIPQIKKELKAASLKGDLVLSSRGVF